MRSITLRPPIRRFVRNEVIESLKSGLQGYGLVSIGTVWNCSMSESLAGLESPSHSSVTVLEFSSCYSSLHQCTIEATHQSQQHPLPRQEVISRELHRRL